MKKLIIILFSVLICLSSQNTIQASPYMGGEITWECLPNGEYVFTLKYFRECQAIQCPNSINLLSNSTVPTIPMNLINGWPKDITPQCNPNPNFIHITCASATQINTGAIDQWVYKSASTKINGVPPANGWVFYYQWCCRNPSTNISNALSQALIIRAKMHAYKGQNTYPCYDNSPQFAETPTTALEAGYATTIKNLAYDPDMDSLVYSWGQPLKNSFTGVNYAVGYSYTNPLPNHFQNPNNIAATINPSTGLISYTSYTSGVFVISVKITSYKNGFKVAEVWREIQMVLIGNTNTNSPPRIIGFDTLSVLDTFIYVGDTLNLDLLAIDNGLLPSSPVSKQTIAFEAFSEQFGKFVNGTNPIMLDSIGCQTPPCATLYPAAVIDTPIFGQDTLITNFSWKTSCAHMQPPYLNNNGTADYTFTFKVEDDYCPFPAFKYYELKVKLLPLDSFSIDGPDISCIKVLNDNSIEIFWNKINENMGAFKEYAVYISQNGSAYSKISTNNSISDTSLVYNKLTGLEDVEFKIEVLTSCADNGAFGNSISPIFLKAHEILANKTILNWNAPVNTLPSNYTDYYIYKSTSANNWSLITTTSNTSFMDTISHNIDSVKYRVEISNSVCTSISNIAKILPSGIEESDLSEKIKIYPNPAKEFLKLEWEADLQIDLVEIYNTSSQLIFKKEFSPADRSSTLELNDISKGVYIVILKGDGINYLEKVLIE